MQIKNPMKGHYSLVQPDGTTLTVYYFVNGDSGCNANTSCGRNMTYLDSTDFIQNAAARYFRQPRNFIREMQQQLLTDVISCVSAIYFSNFPVYEHSFF